MATSKGYKDYILEQLNLLDNITCRPMMGGYLIYCNNILFGGLYGGDNFLVKIVETNKKYNMKEKIPYDGSKKTMYLVEDVDNKELLKEIVIDTCKGLSNKK
jgi:TfoX/Sxy family transcriptional regulator of competence genes